MPVLIVNAFALVCSFVDPTDCRNYVAITETPPDYTVAMCERESFAAISEMIEASRPGYLVASVRCEFLEGQGA